MTDTQKEHQENQCQTHTLETVTNTNAVSNFSLSIVSTRSIFTQLSQPRRTKQSSLQLLYYSPESVAIADVTCNSEVELVQRIRSPLLAATPRQHRTSFASYPRKKRQDGRSL